MTVFQRQESAQVTMMVHFALCCTALSHGLSLETQPHLLASSAIASVLHVLYFEKLFAKFNKFSSNSYKLCSN